MLLLGLVSVDFGICYQCLTSSTYSVFTHKLKGRRMLFIGAVTRSFFQLLIVVFPTCAQQAQLNGYLEKPYS